MRLRAVIGVLLVIQALLFFHMLSILSDNQFTGYNVASQGGTVVRVDLSPTTVWGGVYGNLVPDGQTTITITQMDVINQNVYYVDPDNNCSRTQLIAGPTNISAGSVSPITPAAADAILGYSTQSGFSVSQMFDTQRVFDLNGQAVTLWTAQTNGQLSQFYQGVGQVGGNVVFVTDTGRNTQAYNGEYAGYQFILPAGTWTISYDSADTCAVLDEIQELQEPQQDTRLDVALPTKVCVQQETQIYAVELLDRSYCRPSEVGSYWCSGAEDIDVTITAAGQEIVGTTSAEGGEVTFTPTLTSQHTVKVQDANRTTVRAFTPQECLEPGWVTSEGRTIRFDPVDITAGGFSQTPNLEEPGQASIGVAKIEATLISSIAVLVIILGLVGYMETHKDSVELLLRLRIWFLERFG